MSLSRLIKSGVSLLSGQGAQMVNQLLLPPLFLKGYGVVGYGEWLTLSSAAQYLGTLNFGLHNYANNHAAIAYNRGDLNEVNVIQATAFVIMLAMVAGAAALAALVLLLPLSDWLHLSTMSSLQAAATVYCFGLMILIRMVFGFLQTAFLVTGEFHRGSYWSSGQFVAGVILTAVLALAHTPFVWMALALVILTMLCTIAVGVDLYTRAPVAFPHVKYFARHRVMDILKPSGYFGLLYSSMFLVYQVPVIILQRMLGPVEVVVFSISRTIFSMCRQALMSASTALGPEITESYGRGNWGRLLRLYDLSERVVFSAVPVVTCGTFLAAPALISLWLRKPELFHADVCLYMALISAAAAIKEHKYQFQISVNEHTLMARFIFSTYVAMVVLTIPLVSFFGLRGFLCAWLLAEVSQAVYILKLNRQLFRSHARISIGPIYRVAAVASIGIATCFFLTRFLSMRPVLLQFAVAASFASFLLVAEYPIFGLRDVRERLLLRWQQRPSQEGLRSVA